MREFTIKYGVRNDGKLVSVENSSKKEKYRCIQCNEILTVRAGEVYRKHFSHLSNSNCTAESIEHKTAKRLIVQVLDESSKNKIILNTRCPICKREKDISIDSSKIRYAHEEYTIGKFKCDVVGGYKGLDVLAIEILKTHAVDIGKATGLTKQIDWIELKAEDVLENPYMWKSQQQGWKTNEFQCDECEKRSMERSKHEIEVRRVCNRWDIPPKDYENYYHVHIDNCRRCGEQVPWFSYLGKEDRYRYDSPPPDPKPWTYAFRPSIEKKGKPYWHTHCPNCEFS